jgi:hypothetical protein
MRYKASCPNCGKKISRWFIFCEPTIFHRCRGCGLRSRMGFGGWVAIFAMIALAVICDLLFRHHIISGPVVIILLLMLLFSTIWLYPYVSSMRLERRGDVQP